jgi:hypothetical protein
MPGSETPHAPLPTAPQSLRIAGKRTPRANAADGHSPDIPPRCGTTYPSPGTSAGNQSLGPGVAHFPSPNVTGRPNLGERDTHFHDFVFHLSRAQRRACAQNARSCGWMLMPGRVPATRGTSPCRHGREQPRRVTRAVASPRHRRTAARGSRNRPTGRGHTTPAEAVLGRPARIPAALDLARHEADLEVWLDAAATVPTGADEPGGVVCCMEGRDLADDAITSVNARRVDVKAACPSHFWRPASPPAASGSSLAPARGRPAAAGTTPAAGIPKLPALTLRAARGDPSRPPGCSAALRPCGRTGGGPLPDGRHRPRRARLSTRRQ